MNAIYESNTRQAVSYKNKNNRVFRKVIQLGGKVRLKQPQSYNKQQQQKQQQYQQKQYQQPTRIDQVSTDQIVLEDQSDWVSDGFDNQEEQLEQHYQYSNAEFQEEQNQIEDELVEQTVNIQNLYEYPLEIIQFQDPEEYESVKAWFAAYLGVKYGDIGNLYGSNRFIPLEEDFVVNDFSRYELEAKSSLFMATLGASPVDLQRFVYKCPEIFCLPNRVLKERLSYLLYELEVKPKRLVAYPQLLSMKPQQIVQKMKRLAFIFKIDLKIVQKVMKQSCRIVLYSEAKAKVLAEWLFDNGYPLSKAGQVILYRASGTLLMGPKRLVQLTEFFKIWGLQREEIKRLVLQVPEVITRDFKGRDYVLKMVFFERVVGYSISRVMYDCPQLAWHPLESHIAPRYYYAMQRGFRQRRGWINQIWRSSENFFVKIPYIKYNTKEKYEVFYREWKMYEWPRVKQELQPFVDEYFQKHGAYIESLYTPQERPEIELSRFRKQ